MQYRIFVKRTKEMEVVAWYSVSAAKNYDEYYPLFISILWIAAPLNSL